MLNSRTPDPRSPGRPDTQTRYRWGINFGLVKDSFPPRTVKVKPSGFLAKTFFFQLILMVKNFLPETLTLPGQRSKGPFAPRLLICCLSQSLSHPIKYIRNHYPKRKPKKESLIHQGRREGMSGFLLKILPEARGWRFLIKPAGLELDSPGRRLTFAFLFWF
jgi:hypothetical protein